MREDLDDFTSGLDDIVGGRPFLDGHVLKDGQDLLALDLCKVKSTWSVQNNHETLRKILGTDAALVGGELRRGGLERAAEGAG